MHCQGHIAHGTSRLHTSVQSLRFLHYVGPVALSGVNCIDTSTFLLCNLYILLDNISDKGKGREWPKTTVNHDYLTGINKLMCNHMHVIPGCQRPARERPGSEIPTHYLHHTPELT